MQLLAAAPAHTFSIGQHDFLLDGKPFQIISGEMHYARVPRPYWRDRLKKARAMGLNTICTYMFWNAHEPTEGQFDFRDNLDLVEFCREAAEEGLWVIIRPGPYTCAEWDLGGLPSWLLKQQNIVLRSADPRYLKPTLRFLEKAATTFKPALLTQGGNVLMVQVENEYGVYGKDKTYLKAIQQTLLHAGVDVPLFHCDWAGKNYFDNGHIPGVMPSINFGGGAQKNFAIFEQYAAEYPKFNSEFWTGWFDYWGGRHEVHSVKEKLEDFKWMIDNGISLNLYMFHGGTTNGFFPGANGSNTYFTPYTTSYDYDAPLDEAGVPNEKFYAFRDVIVKKFPGLKLPSLPEPVKNIIIPEFALKPYASLAANLPKPKVFERPQHMEALGQAYGLILYTHQFNGYVKGTLRIGRVMDRATIFLDGRQVGILDRRINQSSLPVSAGKGTHLLEILVEPMARVNFGNAIDHERKGILDGVYLNGTELKHWKHYQFPLQDLNSYKASAVKKGYPQLYKGQFTLSETGDTYLDTRKLDKGMLWLNGRLIGRYWFIGPQQTLYIPACWLKKGKNEIRVLEMGNPAKPLLQGITNQVWATQLDSSLLHSKTGQQILPGKGNLVHQGILEDQDGWQTIDFPKTVKGRYLCLESTSAFGGSPFTALAELRIINAEGDEIPREEYQLTFADSEEFDSENGLANLLIDNQPTTYWHTRLGDTGKGQPHQVAIDLGKNYTLKGLRCLARMKNSQGRIKNYNVYLSETPFRIVNNKQEPK